MMKWVRVLLKLKVDSWIMMLLIKLLVVMDRLITVFSWLRSSLIIFFVAIWQLRHYSKSSVDCWKTIRMKAFYGSISFSSAKLWITALVRFHSVHAVLLPFNLNQTHPFSFKVFGLSIHHLLNFVAVMRPICWPAYIGVRWNTNWAPTQFHWLNTLETLMRGFLVLQCFSNRLLHPSAMMMCSNTLGCEKIVWIWGATML
jgi:hypothetical protein